MPANNLGVEFILAGDGSIALNAINQVQKGINKLGDSVKNDLTQKLKTLFTVGAIEEVARRTQEWAYNLTQASNALGITTSDMQIFSILANNAKLSEDQVKSFFTSFANARDDAIKGNQDMIQSLQAIGVSFTDLTSNTPTVELFAKVLGNKGLLGVEQGSAMSRAVQNVFGQGSLYPLQSLISAAPKNPLNAGNYPNEVVSDKDVAELTAAWVQTKNNMKKIFTESIPLIKILVELLNTVVKSILGLIDDVRDIAEIGSGIIHGDTTKILDGLKHLGVELNNSIIGLLKTLTQIVDGLANVLITWANKIPFLRGKIKPLDITQYLTKEQDWLEKKAGFLGGDQKTRRENAEAVGAVAPMLIGTGVAQKLIGRVLETAGGGLVGAAIRAEELAGTIGTTSTARKIASTILGKASGGLLELAAATEKLRPLTKWIGGLGSVLGIAGAALVGLNSPSSIAAAAANPVGRRGYNAQIIQQNPFAVNGETNSMLRMGGVFGAGIQLRMIRLTEQMISILNQIQKNTTFFNPYNVQNTNNIPAGGQ